MNRTVIAPIAVLCFGEGVVLGQRGGLSGRAFGIELLLTAIIALASVGAVGRVAARGGRVLGFSCLLGFQLLLWLSILVASRYGGPLPFYARGLEAFSLAQKIFMVGAVALFWAALLCLPSGLAIAFVMNAAESSDRAAVWRTAGLIGALGAMTARSRAGATMAAISSLVCVASLGVTAFSLARARQGQSRTIVEEVLDSVDASDYRAPAVRQVQRTRVEKMAPDPEKVKLFERSLVRGSMMALGALLVSLIGRC